MGESDSVWDAEPRIGKTVGRRRRAPALDAARDTKQLAREWREAFPTPFVPRGVYRFDSHQEADEWLWRMITRPR